MMRHCAAQQGLYKPCLRLGFNDSAAYPAKASHPPLLHILLGSLSPLFMPKRLGIHLVKDQGVVMP